MIPYFNNTRAYYILVFPYVGRAIKFNKRRQMINPIVWIRFYFGLTKI